MEADPRIWSQISISNRRLSFTTWLRTRWRRLDVAELNPDVVDGLTRRMEDWIAKRERETGLSNPIHHQGDWHGLEGAGAFKSSQQAYDSLYIGDSSTARRLQAKSR